MKKRFFQNCILVGFLAFFIGVGVHQHLLKDSRYGWGMFSQKATYDLEYSWEYSDGRTVSHIPHTELKGMAFTRASGSKRRATRYGIGAVRSWINGYLRYTYRQHESDGPQALRAHLRYKINTGKWNEEVLTYPE